MNEERKEYIESLADDYGVPYDMAFAAAELLGENEDFDGLVTALDDYSLIYQ